MNKKRIIAGVLAASVMIGNMAMTGTSVYASTPSNGQKEEVVYIMTDANGKADTVDVVNIFGKGNITDYGNYSSVKMLSLIHIWLREDLQIQDHQGISFRLHGSRSGSRQILILSLHVPAQGRTPPELPLELPQSLQNDPGGVL